MTSTPIPLDTLLAHREWVRTVARAVVRDPNAADDVEQETWLAALSTPPRHAGSLRGWFGAVARSRARRIGRGESRREVREIAASRDEATASAAEIAELADTHRRVVQAVVELDEPYRATILLRYFEGLSIEDVAARTASPVETTRSRLKRGVAKLRERLSKELGTDDRPWALALAPLVALGPKETAVGTTAATGGTAMAFSTKFAAVAAGLLVVAGVGAVVVPKWTGGEERTVAAASDEKPARPPKPDAAKRPTPQPRPRAAAAEDPPPAPKKDEAKPRAPEETAAQKLGRVRFSVSWRETPLREVLAEIASKTGVEIALSAEANAQLGSRPDDVKLESLVLDEAVAANQVLGLVTQLKGLAYVIEEPRVVIVPPGVTRDPAKPVVALPPWTPSAPPAPVIVTGRVTDAAGVVVGGAEVVQVQAGERVIATTDVAGRYEAKLKKPYGSLAARAPWQLTSSAAAVDGQPGAQVTVDLATRGPAGSAAVRVVSADDGAALAGAAVYVGPREMETRRADAPAQPAPWRLTDEKGAATFAAVPPGVQPVSAQLRGYVDFIGTVEVTAGKASPVLEIRLTKAASLEERLAKTRISFNFSGVKPNDVVKFINDAKQLSIVMDPALATTLRDGRISLSVSDRPLDEALRTLCDAIGATYRVQGPVVFITAAKR